MAPFKFARCLIKDIVHLRKLAGKLDIFFLDEVIVMKGYDPKGNSNYIC